MRDFMLTEPVQEILPTSIDNKEVEELLNQFSNAIREAVNYSTHVFKWCTEIRGDDTFLPVFMSFRHVIELLDAVSILVKAGSIDPCKLLLRAILESSFNILYILQKDTKQRAMNFLVWYYNERLKLFEKLDPNMPSGKQFYVTMKKDKLVGKMNIPKFDGLNDAQENIKKLLQKPSYEDVNKEYQRNRGKIKNWYSLFNGPRNLEQLADRLELQGLYNILFRSWSGAVHGTDIIEEKLSPADNSHVWITQIRNPKDAQTLTSISLSLTLLVLENIVNYYVPARRGGFANWYSTKLRGFCLSIKLDKQLIRLL